METPDAHARPSESADVLVIGGGTVGLSAALFLAGHGARVTVAERRAGMSAHPRAAGVNPRGMELFRSAGVEDAIRAATPQRTPGAGVVTVPVLLGADLRAAPRTAVVPPAADGSAGLTPVEGATASQDRLDPVIHAAAVRHGADIRFGVEAAVTAQDDDGVTAEVTDRATGERRTVRARYAIAADGARSRVRTALGIAMDGPGELGGAMISVLFRARLPGIDGDPGFAMCVVDHPEAPGILIPVDGDRWLFHIGFDPADGTTPDDYPADRCRAHIRTAIGVPDLDLAIDGILPWQSTAHTAERFRAGRVLLMGDAAHVVPPVGGFGLNTGIADAYDLGWKLPLVLSGRAGDALLDSYDTERRAAARFTMEQSLIRGTHRELHWDIRPERAADRARAGMASLAVMLFGQRYASGAVIGAPGDRPMEDPRLDGAPGSRLPHLWTTRGDGTRVSTLDLVASGWTLLTGADGDAWRDAARHAAELTGVPIGVHRIGADVRDPDGAWPRTTGLASDGALLVRPDAYVAWRAESAPGDPAGALDDAMRRLLGTRELVNGLDVRMDR
ncbi:MAG TPA: FAD-dependent oxidoreductase [Streptosporangiaceae bacterium]|jgi:2-polyprenyl-6-methoxyphenol hydroxylase-like FAD-dependent oxidoreductase